MKGRLSNVPFIGIAIIKFKEWVVAVQLEKFYTKNEILSMYLNTAEFGSNSYGIKVASNTFFKKLPSEINYSEAAILVGVGFPALRPRNPSLSLSRKKEYFLSPL